MKKNLLVLVAIMLSLSVFAHPGKTDANGGHYSRANGIYHYHHGYEGHYHTDGVCPYDFDDKTDHSNHGSSGGSNAIGAPYVPEQDSAAAEVESPLRKKLSEAANQALDRRSSSVDETKEPYDKDENYSSDNNLINENSSETKLTIWTVLTAIGCAALALYSLWYVVAFAIYLAKEDLGCFLFLAAPFVICSLILLFTYHFKVTLYITITVSLIAILVVFCFKRYNKAKDNIKITKDAINKFEHLLNRIQTIPNEMPAIETTVIPSIYEIGKDGLPKDKTSVGWGHSFTVYKSRYGKKLHQQYGCSSATNKRHVYYYYPRIKSELLLCTKCGYRYYIPNLDWYLNIIKRKRLEEEYQSIKSEMKRIYLELIDYHDLCNKRTAKFITLFSKSKRMELAELNNNYKTIVSKYNDIYFKL